MKEQETPHVLVADWAPGNLDAEIQRLEREGISLSFSGIKATHSIDEKRDLLIKAIQTTPRIDALLFCIAPIDAQIINLLPESCTLLQRMGTGLDNVDLELAAQNGKTVRNTPQYCVEEVAVHATSMLLALHRQLRPTQERLLRGEWSGQTPAPIRRLSTLTLGVLGFGRIGRTLGELIRPLVKRVLYYDEISDASIAWATQVSLHELLAVSDLVSVHLPLTPQTRHVINKDTLAAMKTTALLVNAARGALVDPHALAQALNQDALGGAGLDVFEPEILPADSPLRSSKNTLLTSHTAWYSEDSIQDARVEAVESIIEYLNARNV
jgi:D-3-phosphoglycerate dehydrogenase